LKPERLQFPFIIILYEIRKDIHKENYNRNSEPNRRLANKILIAYLNIFVKHFSSIEIQRISME